MCVSPLTEERQEGRKEGQGQCSLTRGVGVSARSLGEWGSVLTRGVGVSARSLGEWGSVLAH